LANCNICNKEIQEGSICLDCARIQRQQSQKPNTAQPDKNPGSGFSLNNLLKTTPGQANSPTTLPNRPTMPSAGNSTSSPLPRPQSTISPAPLSRPVTPAISQPLNDTAIPPIQQTAARTPGQSPEKSHVQNTPEAPVAADLSGSESVTNPGMPSSRRDNEEKARIEKEIYNSPITGYGDEELETAILAGIMKDSYILDILKGKGLMSGLFSTRFSRGIYQSILSLREESPELSGVDKIVLKNKLRQMNLLDASIQNHLDKIVAEPPPNLDQALHYLELMKEQALKRKLKEVAHDISGYIDNPAGNEKGNLETFTSKIIQDVRNIQKARTTKRINLVKEEMRDIIGDIENRERIGEVEIIGYSFEPMHYLNTAISGFRKGFMYAIAGAPRRGKTTFTLELATRVATLNKIPVLFFTYEQTKKNLTYRLLAKESRLNPDTLQRKKIRSDLIVDAKFTGGWKKMQEYMDYFYIIEATKEDTVDRIRSYAYNAMQDFNTEDIMIFVDYIQKMPLSRNYMDEKFKVEEISTELKGLCIELNNPIMTISSLSKEGCMIDDTPDGDRPTMYHCKGSGELENDLDCDMIQAKDWGDTRELYQQLQHKAEEMGKDTTRIPKVDVVNLYLDKNRDAPEGIFSTIQYLFFIEDNKFIELGPKFEDDRFRFSKIEELVDKLIEQNFIVFYDRPKDSGYNKGRVSIKLKNF
jgi:replicative DNA helicase